MINELKEFGLITPREINTEYYTFHFLDFEFSETNIEVINIPYKETFKLEKDYSEYDNDIISNIKNICLENKEGDLIIEGDNLRKLTTKTLITSEQIRMDSRIGGATNIITNKKLGDLLSNLLENFDGMFKIFIDENQKVDTIYIYRINGFDLPGLVLIYNKNIQKYTITRVGLNPQNSYKSFDVIFK